MLLEQELAVMQVPLPLRRVVLPARGRILALLLLRLLVPELCLKLHLLSLEAVV